MNYLFNLFVYAVKYLVKFVLVFDDILYSTKTLGIRASRNPKLDISVNGILLLHVSGRPLPLLFLALLRIVLQSVLYCTGEHGLGIEVTVGFGNNLPVNASRLA